ncbi:hypothetical protein PMIN07_011771 [Paraphaeosphaeria minitans]
MTVEPVGWVVQFHPTPPTPRDLYWTTRACHSTPPVTLEFTHIFCLATSWRGSARAETDRLISQSVVPGAAEFEKRGGCRDIPTTESKVPTARARTAWETLIRRMHERSVGVS